MVATVTSDGSHGTEHSRTLRALQEPCCPPHPSLLRERLQGAFEVLLGTPCRADSRQETCTVLGWNPGCQALGDAASLCQHLQRSIWIASRIDHIPKSGENLHSDARSKLTSLPQSSQSILTSLLSTTQVVTGFPSDCFIQQTLHHQVDVLFSVLPLHWCAW